MAFSNPSGSAHVGIDIRDVLKKHDSMFSDSLVPGKNRAPTFTKPVSRPTSRPTDISFEAEVIREDSLKAQHGRRAAQTAAYAAAGTGNTVPAAAPNPWSSTTTAQRRRHAVNDETKAFAQRAEDAGFSGRRSGSSGKGFDEVNIVAPVPKGYKMRETPAGRGLSRGSSAANAGGAPSSSAGDGADGLGLMGSSMSISLSSSMPAQQQQQHGGGTSMPTSWSAARAEAAGAVATDAASAPRGSPNGSPGRRGPESPGRHAGGGGGSGATGMTRAREWSTDVENAYRLQVAGYKDEPEALSLGHPPIEYWPDCGFIRKLVTEIVSRFVFGSYSAFCYVLIRCVTLHFP